jgi:hypothetical protein
VKPALPVRIFPPFLALFSARREAVRAPRPDSLLLLDREALLIFLIEMHRRPRELDVEQLDGLGDDARGGNTAALRVVPDGWYR